MRRVLVGLVAAGFLLAGMQGTAQATAYSAMPLSCSASVPTLSLLTPDTTRARATPATCTAKSVFKPVGFTLLTERQATSPFSPSQWIPYLGTPTPQPDGSLLEDAVCYSVRRRTFSS